MRNYYIITWAEVFFQYGNTDCCFTLHNRVFQDRQGNTDLYISAEEAREILARNVAELCNAGEEFSVNGKPEVQFYTWNEVFGYLMKNLAPKANQTVEVILGNGRRRNYTINAITV